MSKPGRSRRWRLALGVVLALMGGALAGLVVGVVLDNGKTGADVIGGAVAAAGGGLGAVWGERSRARSAATEQPTGGSAGPEVPS